MLSPIAEDRLTFPSVNWAKSWPVIVGLVAVLALALALRLPAFERPPQLKLGTLYQDEFKEYSQTLAVMKFHALLPHRPYGIYLILAPQFEILRIAHTIKYNGYPFPLLSLSEFSRTTKNDLTSTFRLLRLNALVFGIGIIILTFLIGQKIGGNIGGFSSALLAASTPLLVNYSRMMYYDIAMVFFLLVYIYLFARTFETRSLRYLYFTVAVSAVAFTMKQNALVLFLMNFVLVFAIIGHWRFSATLRSRHTYFLITMCIAIIAFGYPTLFTPHGISGLIKFISLEHIPRGEHSAHLGGKTRLWTSFLTSFWIDQAPLSVFFALAVGTAIGARFALNRNFGWPVLLAGLLYYIIMGYSEHARDRMLMPLIPLLCLGMAGWTAWVCRWQWRGLGYAVLASITVLAIVPLLSNAVRYDLLLTLPDTRIQAYDWLLENAADGAKIGIEPYGPHLPLSLPEKLSGKIAPDQKTFNAKQFGSLARWTAQEYVNDGYDYLVEARWNYKKARNKRPGTDLDARRVQEGKGARWGARREEILRHYEELAEAFPMAARFTPRPPPAALVDEDDRQSSFSDLLFSNWWNPEILTLWKNRNAYVLGSEIIIHRVDPNYKTDGS
jgi:Dolichyl-phosphate-mannose-protein mannosyltransferase